MKSFLFSSILLLFALFAEAQVGIGTTSPNAALDVVSSDNGLLIPRVALTATNVATVITPTVSELVYNSATTAAGPFQVTPGYYYWDGSLWIRLATGNPNTDWSLLGNAGTVATTNFLGTTDDIDLVFRRNNIRAGFIGDPFYDGSFNSNNGNTSFGAKSLENPTINIASQTGVRNTAFGANVMPGLTTGQRNTSIGDLTLFSNTSGSENTAVGSGALYSNTISSGHVAIGRSALTSYNGPATANIGNTAVGFTSLRDNVLGTGNSGLGYRTLRASTGSNNTAIGFDAGTALTTGSNNIMIGANTVAPVVTGSDQLNIGNTIYGSMAGVLTAGVNTSRTIGINVTAPQGALDITSTTDGLLIPRVALTATTAVLPVTTGTASELVYNTATTGDVTPGFYYLSNATGPWLRLATGNVGWSITGNTGLSGTTNFLGTTDDVDLRFRRNNTWAGSLGATSTSFGVGAGDVLTTANNTSIGFNALGAAAGANNTAVGSASLASNTGADNAALGYQALNANSIGIQNTAIGVNALQRKTTGSANTAVGHSSLNAVGTFDNATAVGYEALFANTASNNTALGFRALRENTSGASNVAVGASALAANTGGQCNTAVGNLALGGINTAASQDNTAVGFRAFALGATADITRSTGIGAYAMENSTGIFSTALGYGALRGANGVNSGTSNVAIGIEALRFNTTGTNNTVIGSNAGNATSTGSFNVFLGNSAGSSEAGTSSNKLYIENSNADANNALIYGEFDNNIARINGQLQIGNQSTTGYNFPSARGTNAQTLQTNGTGTLSWVNSTNNYSLARANLTANQVVNSTGWQKITFNTTLFDTGSEFNTGTNRFVATKVGYYEINAGFHTFNKNDAEYYGIAVYKNGTLYQETSAHHYGDKLISRTINCTISLVINDNIEIYIFNGNAPTTIDGYSGKTYFEVKQIR